MSELDLAWFAWLEIEAHACAHLAKKGTRTLAGLVCRLEAGWRNCKLIIRNGPPNGPWLLRYSTGMPRPQLARRPVQLVDARWGRPAVRSRDGDRGEQ